MPLLQRKRSYEPTPLDKWTTEDELNYLKHIGSFTGALKERTTTRKMQFLRNYIEASKLRVHWAGMDKTRIVDAARRHLAALERQMA